MLERALEPNAGMALPISIVGTLDRIIASGQVV